MWQNGEVTCLDDIVGSIFGRARDSVYTSFGLFVMVREEGLQLQGYL